MKPNIMISCLFVFIYSHIALSGNRFDKLSEIEVQRLNIRMNEKSDGKKTKLQELTAETYSALSGKTCNIDFKATATVQEQERVAYHILNSYIIDCKSNYGKQEALSWEEFNNHFSKNVRDDYLKQDYGNRDRYITHLAALYIMHVGAFELVKTPRAYFWNAELHREKITSKIRKKLNKNILPPFLNAFFKEKITANSPTKNSFLTYVYSCLGNNFYKQFISLVNGFGDISKTDRLLLEISQQRKLSLVNFNQHTLSTFLIVEPVMGNQEFLTSLKKEMDNALNTSMGSQSVHGYNKMLVSKFKDVVLSEGNKYFSADKSLLLEVIKKNIYQLLKWHPENFDMIGYNKSSYEQSIETSFRSLENHVKTNIIENSETHLNVPEIMSMVWDVSARLQQLRDIKNQYLLVKFQNTENGGPLIFKNEKRIGHFKIIERNINSETADLRSRVIGSFAENHRESGLCYPGIAGRLFSDYCNLLLEYFHQDNEYFEFIKLDKNLDREKFEVYFKRLSQ